MGAAAAAPAQSLSALLLTLVSLAAAPVRLVDSSPPALIAHAATASYHVSAAGADSNSGLSPSAAWRTLARANETALQPGDQLLLRRGDAWADEMLQLSVRGDPSRPIRIGSYGDDSAARPLIQGTNKTTDICMLLDAASHVAIDGLAFSTAKAGLYLRYWDR